MRIRYNHEMLSGGLFAVLGLVLWLLIPSQIDTLETGQITAQTFPRIAVAGLGLCGLGLFIQGLIRVPKRAVVLNADWLKKPEVRQTLKSLLFAGLLLLYCVVLSWTNFLLSTALLVVAVELYYGARKWYAYAIPLVMVGVVYYIFRFLLHINLP